jgi:hypothetical protein
MLIAWSDHEGQPFFEFLPIHLINAYALIWCLLLHLMSEFGPFIGF